MKHATFVFYSIMMLFTIALGASLYHDWAHAEDMPSMMPAEIISTGTSQKTEQKKVLKPVDPCESERKRLNLPKWWKLNDECRSGQFVDMAAEGYTGENDREQRVYRLFQNMGYTYTEARELWDIYRSAGRIARVRGDMILCIAYADSGLGKKLLTTNNPGNVGNNDRGDKQHFKTIEQGIYAIAQTLNNKYLGHKNTLIELSLFEMQKAGMTVDHYYASGKNWAMNVANCESMLLAKEVGYDFNYRF